MLELKLKLEKLSRYARIAAYALFGSGRRIAMAQEAAISRSGSR